ncbi:hypothetical protein NDN08_000496 [Rhodosorus marinus]|uniref:Uncharacterized protein n=1 Tax=Rhodosorus marinus TaxID=101924 RepID=A0AAV8UN29_9RHOD|nr:hypothetical protein NDN08_000496 [Rhodosorus marinus]
MGVGFVGSSCVKASGRCRDQKKTRLRMTIVPGEWDVVDNDPSCGSGVNLSFSKRCHQYWSDIPNTFKTRRGSGMWRDTDFDESRNVPVDHVHVAFDETHVEGSVLVDRPVSAPKQRSRPERKVRGIWAMADLDPSRMSVSQVSKDTVDVDPSKYGFVVARLAQIKLQQRKQPAALRSENVDVDPSNAGDMTSRWDRCDLDGSSVGSVALAHGKVPTHAKLSQSMADSNGLFVDKDPSCMSDVDEKEADKAMWSNVGWDETHDVSSNVSPRRTSRTIPMQLLWLLEQRNRVFLETVAGGNFVIIARSGGTVAAAFVIEGADLRRTRAEMPSNMGLHEVTPEMYSFLRKLAQEELDDLVSKFEGKELIMAGDGI